MSTTQTSSNTTVYGLLVILQCFLWGVGNPITKLGLETFPPFHYLAIRFTLAFIIFAIFFGRKITKDFKREYWTGSIIISFFTAGSYIFSSLAFLFTTATVAGFLMSLAVVFTPVLAFFILKERVDKKIILAICIIVVGMYLLCANGGTFSFGLGEFLAILTALSGAGMLIYSSKHVSNIGPVTLATIQIGICGVLCIVFALIFEDFRDLSHVAPSGWWSLLYITIFCTCIVYLIQNFALRKVSAVFVSLAFCSEPLFTAIASFILLGETLSLQGVLGCVLILAGLVFATLITNKENNDIDSEDASVNKSPS